MQIVPEHFFTNLKFVQSTQKFLANKPTLLSKQSIQTKQIHVRSKFRRFQEQVQEVSHWRHQRRTRLFAINEKLNQREQKRAKSWRSKISNNRIWKGGALPVANCFICYTSDQIPLFVSKRWPSDGTVRSISDNYM